MCPMVVVAMLNGAAAENLECKGLVQLSFRALLTF